LFNFFDFSKGNWNHIKATNPIESTFATVRLRTKHAKKCLTRMATLIIVFKLAREAEQTWRSLRKFKYSISPRSFRI
jgi:transposase-like protein